ncbi:FecCD family ABC transporter permease [Pseudomonas typographi]|uniref:Iron ABC transporter permease n=1 Tax=Pseudomonas typographi TaxID=2715964 RepID=A0ABR7Z1C0_9PSED|nr:iron ABC transporter permease [Pseudomonas typographi]MBD1551706.1 iron ABC transporter permease [Pseudomonas typographi]MBD1587039.1 iron ABC transporter permease [Pseudomonas typographi]MBD1599278.1 iron ABC transporter permease [Pseudomonas typographi]
MSGRGTGALLLGLSALPLSMLLATALGEMPIPWRATLHAVLNGVGLGPYPVTPIQQGIIWDYRASRAVVAACCGAGLALCGTLLQALLRNALAEPYVLGISAGASTGAVLVMVVGAGGAALGLPLGAFLGATLAFVMVLALAARLEGGPAGMILAGVAGSQLFNALTAYVVSTSANAEQARSVMFWLLGSLGGVRWGDAGMALAAVALGLLISALFARSLDAFTFGETAAASLGVPVTAVRLLLLAITALITAALVSIVGAVGFVGLVVPHAARLLVGPGHARLLPAAVLMGAHFVVLADIASRLLVPQQVLPIGVVTALVGAPAFAWILYRTGKRP